MCMCVCVCVCECVCACVNSARVDRPTIFTMRDYESLTASSQNGVASLARPSQCVL